MLKILIVEDEKMTSEMIAQMVSSSFPDALIVGQVDSVANGISEIIKHKPDIILLDINLKDGNGFEILERTQDIDYMVVFITAYSEYAVKAFKISAIDYLLKPIDLLELVNAIEKCIMHKEVNQLNIKLKTLFSNLKTESNHNKKIVLKSTESINVVPINEIIRCESDKSYTTFYLKENRKILVSTTLKEFENLLTEYGFFRPHQSHLVNTNYIDSFEKPHGGLLIMNDKSRVPVSTRKREALFNLFNNL
ncbi:MAG: LytTR family DNA-binding domain-containing protein [Bacteroidetes bacterium]|nr:LytTR family DNA-binding domain-containing protein [Bacteroidota bacterium]MBU1115772.1 LytTR family DNA-binding domain-containing protein [Bacteroidota bacterium]MBU1798518.1 LytTR family DNA-binding domain-containing protein [Bacteroidota bacterium]